MSHLKEVWKNHRRFLYLADLLRRGVEVKFVIKGDPRRPKRVYEIYARERCVSLTLEGAVDAARALEERN